MAICEVVAVVEAIAIGTFIAKFKAGPIAAID